MEPFIAFMKNPIFWNDFSEGTPFLQRIPQFILLSLEIIAFMM